MSSILEVSNLSVNYQTLQGPVQALRNVDLKVPRGRIVGLVGESGCGKSTLISSIMRLTAANAEIRSGEIRFDGRNLLELSEEEMRRLRGDRISIVFQDPMTTLNPVLSIGFQMVDIQFRSDESKSSKRRRASEMLGRVGIQDAAGRLDNFPHELSGGVCVSASALPWPFWRSPRC